MWPAFRLDADPSIPVQLLFVLPSKDSGIAFIAKQKIALNRLAIFTRGRDFKGIRNLYQLEQK
jgi:hypothetical protein